MTKYSRQIKNLLVSHSVAVLFLLGTSLLQTHFVSFMPLLSITGALLISFVGEKVSEKVSVKKLTYIVLIITLIGSMVLLVPYLTSSSGQFKMRDYAISDIGSKDIVIVDSRVYRGRIAWMFNDKEYLEANYFSQIMTINQNLSGSTIPATIYFVECAPDDCGWGTIKDQPELNQSMEQIVEFFKNNAKEETIIYGGGGYSEEKGKPYFKIYKTAIQLHPEIYALIESTHDWFYYPVRWSKPDWYDKYTPKGAFQITFNEIGRIFLWLSVIIALLSPILLFKEIYKNKEN